MVRRRLVTSADRSALAVFQDLGDRRSEAMLLLERSEARLLLQMNQALDRRELLADSMACTDRCLAVFREIGDTFWTARALHHQSEVLKAQGRHDEAQRSLQQAQEATRTLT